MRTAYIPKKRDFQRLQRYAENQRAIYNGRYLDLRNKFLAHRERVDLTAAFANANIRRLGRLLVFLDQIHGALWQLFMNGRKPVLHPASHSGERILKSPLPKGPASDPRRSGMDHSRNRKVLEARQRILHGRIGATRTLRELVDVNGGQFDAVFLRH